MVESKVGLSALKTENDRIGVQKLIDQEVNRLLDIPNEKRKAVSVFLLWMITNPSLLESTTEKSKSSLLTAAQEIVYSDSKLELAVDYIGSRLALQSQGFADMFETTIPLPAFLPNRTLNRIEQLYNEKSNAQQISSETGLSISNVYSAIEKLKRAGKVKPRTEQFNYARVDELDFEVAVKWNAGLPQNRIMTLLNLTNGRFTGIAHEFIELGIVNRRTQHQTISQKRSLDKVMHLRREGKAEEKLQNY